MQSAVKKRDKVPSLVKHDNCKLHWRVTNQNKWTVSL